MFEMFGSLGFRRTVGKNHSERSVVEESPRWGERPFDHDQGDAQC